uniref:Uncharacterized protein n=1 Tax=Avena sativa TaxID=4498 RepID=A0ACD5ZG12_AVESA
MADGEDARRCTPVSDYWRERLNLRELHAGTVKENLNDAKDITDIEYYLEPLQSVGEITGEVLCPYGNEYCEYVYMAKRWGCYSRFAAEAKARHRQGEGMINGEIIGKVLRPVGTEHFIVEVSGCGPRYCRSEVDKEELTSRTRVVLDTTTLTIMRTVPMPEVDFVVLSEQMRQIRELVELPLRNPELFRLVGIKPPGDNSRDIASILFGELQPRSLPQIDRRPRQTYREMPPRHHRAKRDRRWQCLR